MVRAILAGTKTQARQIVKPNHFAENPGFLTNAPVKESCNPFGHIGDMLYVKEDVELWLPASGAALIHYVADGEEIPVENLTDDDQDVDYWATSGRQKRSANRAPRWTSRIDLLIKDVRIERLQDISEVDAIAEGVEIIPFVTMDLESGATYWAEYSAKQEYEMLWVEINGQEAWDANPSVWVLEFERVEK